MWLLNCNTYELKDYIGDDRPPYAILSHRWEDEEVTFKDVLKKRHLGRGWQKVEACCRQAKKDGFDHVWVDTCCIDKRSSAELSEAINSMFRWYKEAAVCYAYLSDVTASDATPVEECTLHVDTPIPEAHPMSYQEALRLDYLERELDYVKCGYDDCSGSFKRRDKEAAIAHVNLHLRGIQASCLHCDAPFVREWDNREHVTRHAIGTLIARSAWFTRGWTLQELLAPAQVIFFDKYWTSVGSKQDHIHDIHSRTGISKRTLESKIALSRASIAEKMSWAAGRTTTRPEDRTYSLLGLFEVNLPLLYGEGERAFQRLQDALIRTSNDASIFAWKTQPTSPQSMLASSPESFNGAAIEGFESCARDFTLSKAGISGKFHIQQHGLDVYTICLGHFRAREKPAEMSYNSLRPDHPGEYTLVAFVIKQVDTYMRVSLDGKFCGIFFNEARNAHRAGSDTRAEVHIAPIIQGIERALYMDTWSIHSRSWKKPGQPCLFIGPNWPLQCVARLSYDLDGTPTVFFYDAEKSSHGWIYFQWPSWLYRTRSYVEFDEGIAAFRRPRIELEPRPICPTPNLQECQYSRIFPATRTATEEIRQQGAQLGVSHNHSRHQRMETRVITLSPDLQIIFVPDRQYATWRYRIFIHLGEHEDRDLFPRKWLWPPTRKEARQLTILEPRPLTKRAAPRLGSLSWIHDKGLAIRMKNLWHSQTAD